MAASMFTLALADHPSLEELVAKPGYAKFGTYRRFRDRIEVKTNIRRPDDSPHPKCGGQIWVTLAKRHNGVWQIEDSPYFPAVLLAAYLSQRSEAFKVALSRKAGAVLVGKVKRYKATPKAYTLRTILNGGTPTRNKDKDADERRKKRGSVNFMAEMLKRAKP